jgi:hypothetical protein
LRERLESHGVDPAECVAEVPEAVRTGTFWIQPALASYADALREDTERLVNCLNPAFRGSPSIDPPASLKSD